MENNSISSVAIHHNIARPQISGTPTIAELRRRVLMRAAKEQKNSTSKKRSGK